MKINKLKETRKKVKLKQIEVAKATNISIRTYQNYEYGERVPDVYTAQLIAQALHTKVEKLFPLPASANAGEDKLDCNQANKK